MDYQVKFIKTLFSLLIFTNLKIITTVESHQQSKRSTFCPTSSQCVPLSSCPILSNLINTDCLLNNNIEQISCGYQGSGLVCCPHVGDSLTLAPGRLVDGQRCGISQVQGEGYEGIGAFPWVARIGFRNVLTGEIKYPCTGSILNARIILTAAHCALAKADNFKLYSVRVGEYNSNTDIDCGTEFCGLPAQDISLSHVVVHPNYQKQNFQNNIALLVLRTPVNFSVTAQPICLPEPWSVTSNNALLVGWGKAAGQSSLVVEKFAVFIPAGWDNMKKINILYENNKHSCKPDDYYRDVIVQPVTRKTINRETEVIAEDEQAFLTRQQQISFGGGPPTVRLGESPLRPPLEGIQVSPRKLNGLKVFSSPEGEGVLANFFNSLFYKKTGSPEGGMAKTSGSESLPDKATVRTDAAAELDRLYRGAGKKSLGPASTPESIGPNALPKQQVLQLPIISLQQCVQLYGRTLSVTDDQLCAGGEAGNDACSGFGGAPLIVRHGNTHYQVGILSFGSDQCGRGGVPSVYTNIKKYITWIRENTPQVFE
ncbi:unnamed protein product [Diabrotica balteata]|uniref:Peptidase S1 domain-containing protein n=1 Tax=Diabrotica balteata TaxID=107213 RepID=A0A9N9SWY3_DIABA|nr:unnamed protein product [Diabrotica balteata]